MTSRVCPQHAPPPTMCRVTDPHSAQQRFIVDRLWPDAATGLDLDEALAGYAPPPAPAGRIPVATNMVTSLDGRAQLAGTAEGLSDRADRRLMRLYRAAFDAVGSGAGTLRKTDFWSSLPPDLVARRGAQGRSAQPLAVVITGNGAVPFDRRWFSFDQPRLLVVGAGSPHASPGAASLPDGTDLLVAPADEPEPAWVLEQLAGRGIGSLLLEGGPTLNSAFLVAGLPGRAVLDAGRPGPGRGRPADVRYTAGRLALRHASARGSPGLRPSRRGRALPSLSVRSARCERVASGHDGARPHRRLGSPRLAGHRRRAGLRPQGRRAGLRHALGARDGGSRAVRAAWPARRRGAPRHPGHQHRQHLGPRCPDHPHGGPDPARGDARAGSSWAWACRMLTWPGACGATSTSGP